MRSRLCGRPAGAVGAVGAVTVVAAFGDADFVELAAGALVAHERRAGPPA